MSTRTDTKKFEEARELATNNARLGQETWNKDQNGTLSRVYTDLARTWASVAELYRDR